MSRSSRSGVPRALALAAILLACRGRLKVGEEIPGEGNAGEAGTGGAMNRGGSDTGGTGPGGETTGGAKTSAGEGGFTGASGSSALTGGTGGFSGSASGGATASGGRDAATPVGGTAADGGGVNLGNGGTGNQTWIDDIEPTSPYDGSSEGCPLGPVHPEGECESDGLTCGYLYEDQDQNQGYQECACTRIAGGTLAWNCYAASNGPDPQCPSEPPSHGDGCFGYLGLQCSYPPRIDCYCDIALESWDCPAQTLEVPEYLEPPSNLDPERKVAELSGEEREEWCKWYALAGSPPGSPAPVNQPVDDRGYVHPGCGFDPNFCQVGLPFLSAEQCVANLRLTQCGSPLSNLSECVSLVRSGTCGPFDYGCLDYRETPDCIATIVVPYGDDCSVRVE
jgi:hypothetical protein